MKKKKLLQVDASSTFSPYFEVVGTSNKMWPVELSVCDKNGEPLVVICDRSVPSKLKGKFLSNDN